MSLFLLDSPEKYPYSKVKLLYFFQFLSTDCIKCTLCLNHIVSIPIQPIIEVKASVRNKTIEIKKKDTSKSGKLYNTNLMVEGSTVKYSMLTLFLF